MSCLERWSVVYRILSAALVMASYMGIEVYRDITSRLHVLLVVKSPACMHVMSSRLFSRCAGTSFNFGLRAFVSSHEMRWVGSLVLDTIGRILISRPVLWVLMRW